MKKFIILFFIVSLQQAFIYAEDFIERVTSVSFVNWTKGEVFATGTGILKGKEWTSQSKVDAHRAASLDAFRKLLEVIGKINIDSNIKIENVMESDTVRNKVEGVVRNFSEREVRFLKDGICEVDVFVPINGDGTISDIFLSAIDEPSLNSFKSINKQLIDEKEDMAKKDNTKNIAVLDESDNGLLESTLKKDQIILAKDNENSDGEASKITLISGLVIDSKNHPVRPALNPKIITENGEEVYGYKKANRDFRRVNGLVSYAASMEDACLDQRVIQTPIVIESVGTPEDQPCIIIIKNEDADKFLTSNGSNRVLNHCRVIIVTKPEVKEI